MATKDGFNNSSAIYSIKVALSKINEQIATDETSHIFSGIKAFDKLTSGWTPGELCIVGGRPSMGKTSLILSCIAHNVIDKEIPIALFSATDSFNENFLSKVVAILSDTPIACGKEAKLETLRNTQLGNVPFYISLSPKLTLSRLRKQVELLIKDKGVRCVFIETIQSIFATEDNGNTKERMERICHELNIMAKELNVPFIVSSDLNRGSEQREGMGKRPEICDLRSSSAIENEADSVYLLHRPAYYQIIIDEYGNDLIDRIDIFVAKNKNGKTGTIPLRFDDVKGIVCDIEGSDEPSPTRSSLPPLIECF